MLPRFQCARSFRSKLGVMQDTGTDASPTHPILSSLRPVLEQAGHVFLCKPGLEDLADRLAQREWVWPDFDGRDLEGAPPADRLDLFFVSASINFAFTDFQTGEVFRLEEEGCRYQDAAAMMACLRRAYRQGLPVLEGGWLRRLDIEATAELFAGATPIPMLEERRRILAEIGAALEERFGGRFHHYLERLPPRAYAGGNGLLERLPRDFPSFLDIRVYRGARVLFLKRAQLLLWQLHAHFRSEGYFRLEDVEQLTIFADYIVPMALEQLGVLRYSDALREAIQKARILPEGSEEEVEIRAFSIWACHLLTRKINSFRDQDRQIIDPLLDAYLWFNYHESPHPHHLTTTNSY